MLSKLKILKVFRSQPIRFECNFQPIKFRKMIDIKFMTNKVEDRFSFRNEMS